MPQNKKFVNNRLQEYEVADLEEVIYARGIPLVNEVLYSALIRVCNDINHPGQSNGKAGRVIVVFFAGLPVPMLVILRSQLFQMVDYFYLANWRAFYVPSLTRIALAQHTAARVGFLR